MPHKFVEKETVEKLERSITYIDDAIASLKLHRSGKKEGLDKLIQIIKDLRDTARLNKDYSLSKGTSEEVARAAGYFKEEQAYTNVIELYESPEKRIEDYRHRRKQLKAELDTYRTLEVR